jgi:F-type H+-transporting ATPase subunit delta
VIIDPVTMRYTEALFELASDKGLVDEVHADVQKLAAQLSEGTVGSRLFDARIPLAERRSKVGQLIEGCHELTRNFVELLFTKNRELVLADLAPAFRQRWLASRGAAEGYVESALALGSEEISELAAAIGAQLGKDVMLENRINSDLVGGVRVFVDNRLIDYSVKGRLAGLRRRMMEVELPTAG